MLDGLQLPLIPLVEVVGNDGALAFWQSGPILANVGVTFAVMAIDLLPVALQPPLLVTVTPSVTVPEVAAVYLMLLVPLPDVIVDPLLIDHT